MSDTVYIIFVIVLLLVIVIQYIYIQNLKKAVDYAAQILKKYETALLMEGIIGEVKNNESKADKAVSE